MEWEIPTGATITKWEMGKIMVRITQRALSVVT